MKVRTTRALTGVLAIAALAGALAQLTGGCQQNQVTVPVRSLNRSGRVSFVCLGPPLAQYPLLEQSPQVVERPLSECSGQQFTSPCQYESEDDAGDVDAGAPLIPHLYALVTQTTTGEIAVVDTNSYSNAVLDENPREPGSNFLHVGALPTGLVSTPGSVASFVGVAELGREGFFALPSSQVVWTQQPGADPDQGLVSESNGSAPDGGSDGGLATVSLPGIRPSIDTGFPDSCYGTGGSSPEYPRFDQPVPGLTSWPACYLGYAPGDMLLIPDPGTGSADGTGVRPSCDDNYVACDPNRNGKDPRCPAALPHCSATQGVCVKECRTDADCADTPFTPNCKGYDPKSESFGTCVEPSDLIASQDSHGGQPVRQKLVVTVPDLGGIAVIDADWLLARKPGTFDECKVERWLPLQFTGADHTGLAEQPAPPMGPACSNPIRIDPPLQSTYSPRPSGLSYADGTLYVADIGAPVIHVVDMHDVDAQGNPIVTPCNPVERAPLLPTSAEDPSRVVFASRVSVAQILTPEFPTASGMSSAAFKRYLYATDVDDASAMVFDVSAQSTTRRPLQRKHPEWNPFEPRDRVKFAAPPADIVVVQRDVPQIDPVTGVAQAGLLCNPDPAALPCPPSIGNVCDVGTKYRTTPDYTLGAGPGTLRGEFAFASLTSGKLAVIDVADFDAPCRGPVRGSVLAGCQADTPQPAGDPLNPATWLDSEQVTAGDLSCNTVDPLNPRDIFFEAIGVNAGNHVPSITTYPILYNADGSVFDTTKGTPPMMVATFPWNPPGVTTSPIPPACTDQVCDPHACGTTCDTLPGCPLQIYVGGVQTPLNLGSTGNPCASPAPGATYTMGAVGPNGVANTPAQSALVMNLEDPRAQIADQNWTVTFEGAIPGFESRVANLFSKVEPTGTCDPNSDVLCDSNSRFCDAGVLSQAAVADMLAAQGPNVQTTLKAADLADYVQITNDLADPSDQYWQTNTGTAFQNGKPPVCFPGDDPTASSYSHCLAVFGTTEVPELLPCRDFRILEAYQDHLELESRDPGQCVGTGFDLHKNSLVDVLKCCFPTPLTFTVRGGNQWMVVGDQSLFLHHVVADAGNGKCRNSCDPVFARRNGRVLETSSVPSNGVPDRVTDPSDPRYKLDPGNFGPSTSFINPMFRFAVVSGSAGPTPASDRDLAFHFATTGAFAPQLINLAIDGTSLITPQAVTYLSPTQEVVVTDGSFNGIIFVTLQGSSVSRSFF